ncbi:MAG TPA: DUF3592 domain-containing protein [Ignavibacteria bacterium]
MKKMYLIFLVLTLLGFNSCGFFEKKIDNMTKDIKEKVLKEVGVDKEKREQLIKTGKEAKGVIQKVEDTQETFNQNPKIKMTVKVKPENEEEFDAVILMYVSRVSIPRVGDKVKVYYDPNNKTDIIVY